ncbi:MAG: glutamine synthetase III [Oscillospiraceae bacterium]|nr:glutamine synthetase III [Oscillospiraceae bacterium]
MRERLPKDIYDALKKTIHEGIHLELEVGNAVAEAMKDWAVEKGATHFTHWFQPMTGVTAEKHDSFISPGKDGGAIMDFSGKALVRGESDASSFPSGGLRATFEARGYTVWDTTSYAFIKDSTLCIPTAFCSYGGESLDKKTPLLRSMQAVSKQALRILRLFGDTETKKVTPQVGAEQEYFLIDKAMFLKRPDLVYTGRTLFGAPPPKGEELGDHYFGSLTPRVAAFMKELDEELWKLGIFAKTKHNEVAPSQHELATIYSSANTSTDYNQITMELMKIIANRHGMTCLLHEKPFEGISGSGKHNNWSLSTDGEVNLLEPGKTPHENAQFLLFISAVIKAVDEYHSLLRASAASAGNDLRLGANEAPPAIISVFLGEELTEILDSLEKGEDYVAQGKSYMEIGVTVLPHFRKHTTDRNRTSPFAFTGNKFEFRMPGSAFSVAEPNIVLNTAVAETLRQFADELEEKQKSGEDFKTALSSLIKRTYKEHKRIIFNGNNYSHEWRKEAKSRGLPNMKTTIDALPSLINDRSVELFERHGVLTDNELMSRYEILTENYCKSVRIEAMTMIELVKSEIIPSCVTYQNELVKLLLRKKELGGGSLAADLAVGLDCTLEEVLATKISNLSRFLHDGLSNLENITAQSQIETDLLSQAIFCRNSVFDAMSRLREIVDELEVVIAKKYRRLPSYGELLFSVN